MTITKLKPSADKRILVLLAGLIWCAVGIMLVRLAVSWLLLWSGRDQILYYAAGFLTAMPIHHFGFLKIADKNLRRLLPLTEKSAFSHL